MDQDLASQNLLTGPLTDLLFVIDQFLLSSSKVNWIVL